MSTGSSSLYKPQCPRVHQRAAGPRHTLSKALLQHYPDTENGRGLASVFGTLVSGLVWWIATSRVPVRRIQLLSLCYLLLGSFKMFVYRYREAYHPP